MMSRYRGLCDDCLDVIRKLIRPSESHGIILSRAQPQLQDDATCMTCGATHVIEEFWRNGAVAVSTWGVDGKKVLGVYDFAKLRRAS